MRKKLAPYVLGVALLAASVAQALPQKMAEKGQEPGPGESPHQSGALPIKTKPEGTKAVVHTMADALGLVRRNSLAFPPVESVNAVNRLQIGGAGTMTDLKSKASYKVSRYVYGFSLANGAARLDLTRSDSAGKSSRMIEVISGDKAWDEVTPGVGGAYTPDKLLLRRYLLAIYPQAFARAAANADPATVTVTENGGVTSVTVPVYGTPMTATLDQDYRPTKIVVTFKDGKRGATTLEGDYANYRDMTEYGVMFPRDMTLKLNGAALLNIKVDDARVGPYILFPEPTATVAH